MPEEISEGGQKHSSELGSEEELVLKHIQHAINAVTKRIGYKVSEDDPIVALIIANAVVSSAARRDLVEYIGGIVDDVAERIGRCGDESLEDIKSAQSSFLKLMRKYQRRSKWAAWVLAALVGLHVVFSIGVIALISLGLHVSGGN